MTLFSAVNAYVTKVKYMLCDNSNFQIIYWFFGNLEITSVIWEVDLDFEVDGNLIL